VTRHPVAEVDLGVATENDLNTVCHSNEEGFSRLLRLYARKGQTIADPTYGNGRFWKNIDQSMYDVRATDLTGGVDFRSLPYANQTIDLLVLDPPYRYTPEKNKKPEDTPGHGKVDGLYNLQAAKLKNTQAVIDLYVAGFTEAKRTLRPGGFLIVKCQDTVQDGTNIWVHMTLMQRAEALGFACRDLLIVAPASVLKTRWERQRHLRKAHSYFLVLRLGGHFPFGMPSVEKR
jgi:hypothetical protein